MIKPGMFFADRYEIIDTVGSGGMADVYKARCHKLNRFVAIKVLKQEFSSDESFVDKFRAEAQSAAGLSHPNIVNVYDVGEENGIYYIVMELIEGITLKNFIERKGRLEVREATGIAIQIAQGLEAAHNNSIIHRDIKPQNIIISKDGKVKVADFGIAKAASSNTLTSSAMGSVHYISPEQARGGYSDEKSDIYSLGITMYEMISGKVPYEGDNAVSIALLHIQEETPVLSNVVGDIPISTDKIVLKCLQKKPERRYLSVVEMISDLKRSLVEPYVDFVVIPDVLNNSPTIALSQNDVDAIRAGAAQNMHQEMMHDGMMQDGMMQDGMMHDGMMHDGMMGRNIPPMNQNDMNQYPNNGPQYGGNDMGYNDEFIDPEEEQVDDKLEKVTKIGAVVILIFIICIIAFVLMNSKRDNDDKPTQEQPSAVPTLVPALDTIEVRDVTGQKKDEAKKMLEQQGFTVLITEIPLTDASLKDIVQSQTPAAGTPWEQGVAVTIFVYTEGAEEIEEEEKTMIDVKGNSTTQAVKDINKLFDNPMLQYEVKSVEDEAPVGAIVKTKPAAGEKLKNTGKVIFYVSVGTADTAQVPSLFGKDVDSARAALEAVGLKLGNISYEENENYTDGTVLRQKHPANSSIDKGTPIDVTVNRITKTATPTPQPTEEEREKTYKVKITMQISPTAVFDDEENDSEGVGVKCSFKYKGSEISSNIVSLSEQTFTGTAEFEISVTTKHELTANDINKNDISYSFHNAAAGAKESAETTNITVE